MRLKKIEIELQNEAAPSGRGGIATNGQVLVSGCLHTEDNGQLAQARCYLLASYTDELNYETHNF